MLKFEGFSSVHRKFKQLSLKALLQMGFSSIGGCKPLLKILKCSLLVPLWLDHEK